MTSPPLGQLLVVSPPLTFGSASNQSMSLHDVTAATVSATKIFIKIKEKSTAFA